jgi:hypothetical protein
LDQLALQALAIQALQEQLELPVPQGRPGWELQEPLDRKVPLEQLEQMGNRLRFSITKRTQARK